MATVNISFRTDSSNAEKLDELAKATGQTRTEVIDDALERYFFLQDVILAKIDAGIAAADAGRFATDKQVKAEFARWRSRK